MMPTPVIPEFMEMFLDPPRCTVDTADVWERPVSVAGEAIAARDSGYVTFQPHTEELVLTDLGLRQLGALAHLSKTQWHKIAYAKLEDLYLGKTPSATGCSHAKIVLYDTGFPSSKVERICAECGKVV